MTNDEARILMERILLVPVAEVDAAMILAGIEERLRNEAAQQSVQPTVLESVQILNTSCSCPLCQQITTTLPHSG